MILGRKFQERVKELVNDPVFEKPIQMKLQPQKGQINLITKIRNYERVNN